MRLAAIVLRELPDNLRTLALMNVLSAIATAALLWLVDAAAKDAAKDIVSPRLLVMYAVTVTLFGVTHNYALVTASQDAERLIHKIRLRLFDLVRRADLVTVDRIGRASLHGVLTQDTQTLAQTLPLLAIGGQQAVMLVFLAVYLAWLSPLACVMAFAFAGIAVAVKVARVQRLRRNMMEAAAAESRVFDGLTDLLRGFKEVRMNRRRGDGLIRDLADASSRARAVNVDMKERWGRNFALVEGMFYTLIGMMVFVVPLFTTGYHTVVVAATTAALFIVGPVSTVSFVTPLVAQTEMALSNIEAMEERLRAAAGSAPDKGTERLPGPPTRIALTDATFAYHDDAGAPVFAVGPLSAEFRAGEITFVTGGNGSGKSTMLRLLTGLMPLDGGQLLADGEPVPAERMQSYRDMISAIFSDYHLSRRLYGVADPDPARVRALLERLEMQDKVTVADGGFSTVALSTGQRKRLALVVAQLEDKPVIVLDEWAADQDPHFRRVFYEELLPELKALGKIVICVTHDERWFGLADRVYHMNEGRIEEGHGHPHLFALEPA
ncbi:putative ATP-binding cassette transporter [Azospirillum brasilense]|uniref:Putative ATP-binding cassette transporter n=1 Tax=Azospirillum brasilense TaxID=192 RepID=A0A560C3T3_AZOBR|nr:cyclic peptide export ABC transporter [Azospirillum brasilense]TWA79523.1 putative ATP-binding cassette transporter [Azospirillum brasilense]